MIPMVTPEPVVEWEKTWVDFPKVQSLPLHAKIPALESSPEVPRTQSPGTDPSTSKFSNSENRSLSSAERALENQSSKEVTESIELSFHGDTKFLEVEEQSEEWSEEEEEESSEEEEEEPSEEEESSDAEEVEEELSEEEEEEPSEEEELSDAEEEEEGPSEEEESLDAEVETVNAEVHA